MLQSYSGSELSVERNGPDLYLMAVGEKLELYATMTYKNGADVWKFLKQDQLHIFTHLN